MQYIAVCTKESQLINRCVIVISKLNELHLSILEVSGNINSKYC